MYGVKNYSWNPTLFVLPNKNSDLKKGERERERERERDFGRVNMREFLFGNSQIWSMSQGLISKTSCIELGTPHETRPYLLYQTKI